MDTKYEEMVWKMVWKMGHIKNSFVNDTSLAQKLGNIRMAAYISQHLLHQTTRPYSSLGWKIAQTDEC